MTTTSAACGKKGPPLAPIVRIPASVQTIEAKRIGSDVYISLTVPAENIDGWKPADLDRIDVYGFTGSAPPPRGRFLEGAAMVASVSVAPPVTPEQPSAITSSGARQGMSVTVRDTLEPGELVPAALTAPAAAAVAPAPSPPNGPLRRFYMALPYFGRRPGPQGTLAAVAIAPLPEPPSHVQAAYTESAATVSWEPSGGLVGFLLDRALPAELPPTLIPQPAPPDLAAALHFGPTRYNVYRQTAPDPLALPLAAAADAGAGERPPTPVNPMPLDVLTLTDPLALDERERCYTVRAVRGAAPGAAVEGEPSAPACVTPVDVFPPAAPQNVSPVTGPTSISLIWEPSGEADFGGYLVLRREAGGDTLTLLTSQGPIPDARFIDDTVRADVTYVYEIVAVDRRVPVPNRSDPARIEVTAR